DHRAHRAAHERELERAGHHRLPHQHAGHRDQRVLLAGFLLRLREPVAIALAVTEPERVERLEPRRDLLLGIGIEEPVEALACADAHVVLAFRAHVEVALELGAVELRVAVRTLDPDALRHGARALLRLDARGHQLFEPAHAGIINDPPGGGHCTASHRERTSPPPATTPGTGGAERASPGHTSASGSEPNVLRGWGRQGRSGAPAEGRSAAGIPPRPASGRAPGR